MHETTAHAEEAISRLIQEIYEVDPLTCPKCSGKMKVISVIEEQDIIKKILNHFGIWGLNPPEVLRVKPRPPPRKAMIQPLYAEPHIDY